jgi:hypothetical protein
MFFATTDMISPTSIQTMRTVNYVKPAKSRVMRRMLVIWGLVMALFSSFGPRAYNEKYVYDVFIDGTPVGSYNVDRTELNGTEHFHVETVTIAGLLRPDEHRFSMLSSYDDTKLVASDIKTWINQKLESSSVIHWDGKEYLYQADGELQKLGSNSVTFSSASMFFTEPVNESQLFYERYGKFLKLKHLGDHCYEVTLPNGAKERYTYFDGEVVQMELVQSFTKMTMKIRS